MYGVPQTGMGIRLLRGQGENEHYHSDVELIFVIDGEASVWLNHQQQKMQREDVLVINSGVMHTLECSENAIIFQIFYSTQKMLGLLNEKNVVFACNSVTDKLHAYGELRNMIRDTVYIYVNGTHSTQCLEQSKLLQVLDCLFENYRIDMSIEHIQTSDDIRLQKIFQYVNTNYQNSFNLKDLAEAMYVSTSTLSRFFKKMTGYYFGDYVTNVRLKHAVSDLLNTDKNMTRISADCGFSNPSVFNKTFKNTYGMTPSEYRVANREQVALQNQVQEEMRLFLRSRLEYPERMGEKIPHFGTIKQTVDMSVQIPYQPIIGQAMNMGSASHLLNANMQYHTIYLHDMLKFKYGRIWSLFSTKLHMCDGGENHYYNYDDVDSLFDFLIKNHIRPFLDLGKRPATAVGSANQSVYYEEDNIRFTSKKAWEDFFEDFICHLVNRYGRDEVGTWIFEVSCDSTHGETCHYYEDVQYDFFEVYHFMWCVIKKNVPQACVCGIGAITDIDYEQTLQFFKYCRENQCVPEMATFLCFPYVNMNKENVHYYNYSENAYFEHEEIQKMKGILKDAGLDEVPICISEWNCSIVSRNYINDSCFRAAYIVRKTMEMDAQVKMVVPWMLSDWMSSYYDTSRLANGGSGFVTKDTICKPACYALQFLNQLGGYVIAKNDYFIVTRKKPEDYYILCNHFKWFGMHYFMHGENTTSPEEVQGIYIDDKELEIELLLTGLTEDENYVIKRRQVNRHAGSFLDMWKQFGYDAGLLTSDIAYIRESSIPNLSMQRQKCEHGTLEVRLTLEPQEITLLHIYK